MLLDSLSLIANLPPQNTFAPQINRTLRCAVGDMGQVRQFVEASVTFVQQIKKEPHVIYRPCEDIYVTVNLRN